MELKLRREIKKMPYYLPGFLDGFNWNTSNLVKPQFNPSIGSISQTLPGYGLFSDADQYKGSGWVSPTGTTGLGIQLAIDSKVTSTIHDKIDPSKINGVEQGAPKSSISAGAVGNIATSAAAFAGSTATAFGPTKGTNELLSDAGTSYAQGDGFGYQRQNDIDANYQKNELSKENTNNTLNTMATGAALGASVGSIIPGVGTVIGGAIGAVGGLVTGLFGSASRRKRLARKIFAANQEKEASNLFSRTSAHSDYLKQQYQYKHVNTQDDLLYGAKEGKDMYTLMPGFVGGYGVYTNDGEVNGVANSRVAYGETIYNPNKGTANIVKTGKLNLDTNLSYLQPDDIVYGNHVDWRTGRTFRDEALPFAAVLERLNNR